MHNILKTLCLLLSGAVFFIVQADAYSASQTEIENIESAEHIAVASDGEKIDSKISRNAGRAPYYLIFDENGALLKSIKNPAQSIRGGASKVVVDLFLKESCTTVIAGTFGDKMHTQLSAHNIAFHELEGNIKDVLEAFVKQ